MKALIFAAGLGTRLRPLTLRTPKALIPVGGVPMLERVILRLKEAGFDEITINIHHLGNQIIDFLRAHNHFGTTIHLSDERDLLLDTGGGLRKARPYLEGEAPFLVCNADILTDIDLAALYRRHTESQAEATLLVSRRSTPRQLLFDPSMRLCGWLNHSTGEVRPADFDPQGGTYRERAFGGIHVISPTLFRHMEGEAWNGAFPIIPFYLSICRQVRIEGYTPPPPFQWFDIGKPETLAEAEKYFS